MIRLSSISIYGIFPAFIPITLSGFKHINIIVGPSGSGKSLLLKSIRSVYLPPNSFCCISDANICDSQPSIVPLFEWNDVIYEISLPLKSIRGKLHTIQQSAESPLPENLILEHEKIRPLYSSSERFVDYKCDEMTIYTDDAVHLFQEIIEDYSEKIEQAIKQAIKEMCQELPFHIETDFDWKKAVILNPCYDQSSFSLNEDYPFSMISTGQKKYLIMKFTLAQALKDANRPVFIDDFEAFLDKNQIDYFINEMTQMTNQFFITTQSSYVMNELIRKKTAIFFSDPKYDEKRCCHTDMQSYIEDFML